MKSRNKSSKICAACANGDRMGALRIAARFFDRSVDTQIFKRGMDAHNHPDFYRQLGQSAGADNRRELLAVKFRLR